MLDENATDPHPIVGIGASAGGLEALKSLVAAIPPNTGASFVIVQHLSPTQETILDQLLQAETRLEVTLIREYEPIEANRIYIVPPGQVLSIEHDRFHLTERDRTDTLHRPIDSFFASIARSCGRDSYCVVLSGTGSDGAEGLKEIKAAGGFAIVQESRNARFPGMPDSAVATGMVDFVLPVEQIPGRLQEIMSHRYRLHAEGDRRDLQQEIQEGLPAIMGRLAEVSGNDFSNYKPGTLVRRIERRMTLMRQRSVEDFIQAIREDDTQANLLAQEFLIGVTHFFRDPEAFEALRRDVIAPLVASDQRNIRIWVPGCSTGEEAYSLAILFLEEMDRAGASHVLQVFGTDIDVHALSSARYGQFGPASLEGLTEEQRERYFTLENGQMRAVPLLREACVFAPHNLVQDPPFSRLDLISCRNLLIYLSTELQRTVMPRLHFSLRPNGYLFLGPSEGLAGEDELFAPVHSKLKIFRKNPKAATRYSALRETFPRPRTQAPVPVETGSAGRFPGHGADYGTESLAEREFLRLHAAPFALVTRSGEVVYLSQRMAEFVRPTHGVPSSAIDAYLARELRVPLRTALADCAETGKPAVAENVMVGSGDTTVVYDIEVSPTSDNDDHFLVSLKQVRSLDSTAVGAVFEKRETADRDMLEIENFNLRRQLASAMQEYESSGQELKSSNEELLSMNEELQSSNEELETSREELQSINEELETVNAELQENNRLLTRANSDLKNLFEGTDIAVLFLDRNFLVRNYTPATTSIFGIRSRDIGRPISDLSSRIEYPQLATDAEEVDRTLQTVEREVVVKSSGETYLVRIRPYRTTANVIDGYVLSFFDITGRKTYEETLKRNEKELARQYAELENLYDTTPIGLCLMDREFRFLRVNEKLAAINGVPADEHVGRTFHDLLPELADELVKPYAQVFETGVPIIGQEFTGRTQVETDGERHWIADLYPVRSGGEVFAVGGCIRDVTEQARMLQRITRQNEHQKLLLGELQHRVKNTLATISAISKLLLRPEESARDYQARLTERLGAISRTHDLLTEADWTTVSFREVLANELSPYGTGGGTEYAYDGPDLSLGTRETLSIGMALHELATNSAKYGALSVKGGRILVRSSTETLGDGRLRQSFQWEERGGPPIETTPERKGFGTMVLERVLGRDLEAEINMDFRRDGLVFTATFDRRPVS
ncbi:chemotaxis protein CheB [Histidinibacterium aquaticum]|uniref:histidine kinase n=1 Tax=Histidinibacterium aquaticum TaxID=2613962 RepID=A0A5J5GK08_9RHOB|nr:chemotaxis protein CheB [Histidinibacterium aquaticum]KAA9008028.1 PAS domain-containing protein [Histidinibacterium aquaticum]